MFDPAQFDVAAWGEAVRYLAEVPYDVACPRLYTAHELFDARNPANPADCLDARVARHVAATGANYPEAVEMWARALHDHHIRKAMYAFLGGFDRAAVVGVMGGHALLRTDADYRRVVTLAQRLTERGRLMIGGGGPGAMEATHLGAWLAGRGPADVDAALARLAQVPGHGGADWLASAFDVRARFPRVGNAVSLAVPTWHFPDEPSTPFATHIAKFFENSIREDVLLSEAYGGIVFMPGGAGTFQEVFQEAMQNHYLTRGCASPMVFVGRRFWTEEVPVYPLLARLVATGRYRNLALSLVEGVDGALAALGV